MENENILVGSWLSESEVPADVSNYVGSIYSKYVFNKDGTFEWDYKEKFRELPPSGYPWKVQMYMSGTYKDKKTAIQLFSVNIEGGSRTVDYTIDNDGNLILYIPQLQCNFPHSKTN